MSPREGSAASSAWPWILVSFVVLHACARLAPGVPPDALAETSSVSSSATATAESSRASPSYANGSGLRMPDQFSRSDAEPDFVDICQSMARAIEALKAHFPQLAEFDSARAITKRACHIDYEYRCHPSTVRGGWAAATPEPGPGGVWFYLGIWDERDPSESGAQINTQPILPRWHIGKRRVTFLIKEGKGTSPLSNPIVEVMERHGLQKAE
jgi:hypothetical protein